ncbi:MAG TPA: ATP-grasp domain-containing protein [Telluria sp.]|jgi:biotin carboxylase
MHVLILGTLRQCHKRLQAQGHQASLIISRDKAKGLDLAGFYRNIVVMEQEAGDAQWLAMAQAMHRLTPFDAVVAFNDREQQCAYQIGQRLEIMCAVDPQLHQLVTDKFAMRAALAAKGIASCRFAFAQGEQAVRSAIDEVGLPCIVKPVAGEGSVGVAKLSSGDDLGAALARLGAAALAAGVIVEEFLEGEEFSVEAISTRGVHHIMAVTKKYKNSSTFVEIGHVVPAPLDAAAVTAIGDYVRAILSAFNYRDCPSHTEIMLTAAGPRIIETHTRLGGDRIVDLVRHSCAVDLYEIAAAQAVGAAVAHLLPEQVVYQQSAAIWYAGPEADAGLQLAEVRGAAAAGAPPYVKSLELLREPGTPGVRVLSSFERSAAVVAVGASAGEALARAQGAISQLEFLFRSTAPAAPV